MAERGVKEFGKVAVLMGGNSAEREISLKSGNAVLAGLLRKGVDAISVDPKIDALEELKNMKIDRVWNALHGRGGEDGTIQGMLQLLGIPFTGSGVLGSAIAMDKWRSKLIWKTLGLPVAPHMLVTSNTQVNESFLRNVVAKLGPTLFVKPSHEGSSVGMSKVTSVETLEHAIQTAQQFDTEVLVESFVDGREYTVSILNGRALPSISMVTPREFYDYEAKYHSNETQYFCPSGLIETEEKELANIALTAFDAIGCSGWGRVDFIRDNRDGRFKILEANTVPGMTETSLVPKAAKQVGISFDDLTIEILKTSL